MIVFPAIDLRAGRCVRLVLGDPNRETVFGDDPLAIAEQWKGNGARWLHVVNLDGALGDTDRAADNLKIVAAIASCSGLLVQFGGGLRNASDVDSVLALGVSRVVIGTAALSRPELIEQCIVRHGSDRLALGLDARGGSVATHGWKTTSEVSAVELACRMRDRGVEWVIYTDIARDGMLTGVNVKATVALARETGMKVTASGGVATIEDIQRLKACESDGVRGVIVGKALYMGHVDLRQAIRIAEGDLGPGCPRLRPEV